MIGCEIKKYSSYSGPNVSGYAVPNRDVITRTDNYSTRSELQNYHLGMVNMSLYKLSATEMAAGVPRVKGDTADGVKIDDHHKLERGDAGHENNMVNSPSKNFWRKYKLIIAAKKSFKYSCSFNTASGYASDFDLFKGTKTAGSGNTDESKINICPSPSKGLVGIKFVNVFAGKFFNPDFQYTRSDSFSKEGKGYGVIWKYVTAENVLVEANRGNEPSVLCQSTFN